MEVEQYHYFDTYLNDTIFIVHDICQTKQTFNETFKQLYDFLKQGFELPEVRRHLVQYKFSNETAEQVKTMQLNNFITNLIFWKPFIKLDTVYKLNSSYIVDCTKLSNKYIEDYINTKIILPNRDDVSNKLLNRVLERLIYDLSRISKHFNPIMGIGINMKSFIDLSKRNPEFNDLIRTKFAPGMQPKEIEDLIATRLHRIIDILKTEDNVFNPILNSGVGIKAKSLQELLVASGLKPDLNGDTIPIPIYSNFMVNGMDSVSSIYIDSQAGKKSVIMNKTYMGISGYFAYKILRLASSYSLSHTIDNCDTLRPIEFTIDNDKFLQKLDGRYYYLTKDMGELKCIDYRKDKWLIGKTIYLRDPSTCTAPDGVCRVCYGKLYNTNKAKHFNVGGFSATKASNKLSQEILSSKHSMRTDSNLIKFDDKFYDFFVIENSKIKVNTDYEGNLYDYELVFKSDFLYEIIEMEESNFNTFTDVFYVRNKNTGEIFEFRELNSEQSLYLNIEITKSLKSVKEGEFCKVNLGKIAEMDEFIAMIIIENNELTKPLKNIMKLLDREDHFNCTTIDELLHTFVGLTIESGMAISAVHSSFILKGLIKDPDNKLRAPRFNEYNGRDKYVILTVTSALLANPSITTSLSFAFLGRQFTSPTTYRKHSTGTLDSLFKLELDK